ARAADEGQGPAGSPRCALQAGPLGARVPAVHQPRSVPLALLLTCVLLPACARDERKPGAVARPRTSPRSVRITMDALHQLGGIPPGCHPTPLPPHLHPAPPALPHLAR